MFLWPKVFPLFKRFQLRQEEDLLSGPQRFAVIFTKSFEKVDEFPFLHQVTLLDDTKRDLHHLFIRHFRSTDVMAHNEPPR